MKAIRRVHSKRASTSGEEALSAAALHLDGARYEAVLRYLFDRSIPDVQHQEWYWRGDLEPFEATPLEWTRFQTLIFANAAVDLRPFTNDQVGMGLTYLMNNGMSDVPYAAISESVPLGEAMRMMRAMPVLWRDCIGPRLSSVHAAIGSGAGGQLGYACYMWFDVWPTFYMVRDQQLWQDALWHVFDEMLKVPCREVQVAALHGIGHRGRDLRRDSTIDCAVDAFLARLGNDDELRNYAEAARKGMVQ
jgi:hypothetical protein